jgi:hypothetical protein
MCFFPPFIGNAGEAAGNLQIYKIIIAQALSDYQSFRRAAFFQFGADFTNYL